MANDIRPQINIRVASPDLKLWHSAAKATGLSLSAWLRMVALKAARRELKEVA